MRGGDCIQSNKKKEGTGICERSNEGNEKGKCRNVNQLDEGKKS